MYAEVEYIEGHGTEFIDTGITLAQMSAARFAIMLTNKAAFSGMGVAGVNTASVPYASLSHYYAPANDKWYIPVNYFSRGNWFGPNVQENVKQEFLLEIPAGKYGCYTVDSARTLNASTGKSSYDNTVPITIFALNNGTATPTEIGGFRLYYFKLFGVNLDTIRDYVPCKNKLTSEVGLFDMVSKQFFGNVGSGAFTAGGEVT